MNEIKKKFRGIIHIHTTNSFDGTLSVTDLVTLAKAKRYDFVVLTEHAEDFDDEKMQKFVNECIISTDKNFLVIPGLEFNINNEIHILGIGIKNIIPERSPEKLIQKIHENNGIAILAHTVDYKKGIPYAQLKEMDFIEIWNPRYGERISPSRKSIKILGEFRKIKKNFIASGGLDLHKIHDLVPLYQLVSSQQLNEKEILNSLKRGEFYTTNGLIILPSLKDASPLMIILIYLCAFMQFIPRIIKKTIVRMLKFVKRYLSLISSS